jgi:hypothetical protein
MKFKKMAALIVGSLLCGCTNLSDKKIEQPWIISIIDIHEANFVEAVLNQNPQFKGIFRVEPGSKTTTVYFKTPPKPADELALRTSMKQIKEILTKQRGRTANTIRFVFPDVTLEE